MHFNSREDIIQMTPLWQGERLPDGRPKVPTKTLERLRKITFEGAWAPMYRQGYTCQTQDGFRMAKAGKVLVGRAVTSVWAPLRPDLNDCLLKLGREDEGRKGYFNQWVIDSLIEDDVVVVDLFDKHIKGTFIGGNLATAIATRTKQGGAVIWGSVRDLEQIELVPGLQVFYRNAHPTAIGDVTMTGFNVPCRIGEALCLPGDVVLGTISGVAFIPAHLADLAAERAEKTEARDMFGFQRLEEGVYSTAQVDTGWTVAMWDDFLSWIKIDPRTEEYRSLTWDAEYEEAKKKAEENSAEVRL